jgi:hypothetical protein
MRSLKFVLILVPLSFLSYISKTGHSEKTAGFKPSDADTGNIYLKYFVKMEGGTFGGGGMIANNQPQDNRKHPAIVRDVHELYYNTITIYMNPSIGIYYDILTEGLSGGGNFYVVRPGYPASVVDAHEGIYYNFSNPGQVIRYNFLTNTTKTSQRHPGFAEGGLEQNLTEIGKDEISVEDPEIGAYYTNHKKIKPQDVPYSCTHLQYKANSPRANTVTDYWMSEQVPGFGQELSDLSTVSPGMILLNFSGTIFNYGGLVKLVSNMTFTNNQVMRPSTVTIELMEAQKGLYISPSMFNPPSN